MGGTLTGIKVVEAASVITGPFAGMLLGDLGAEVIKVEMPGTGDYFRLWDGKEGSVRPSFAAYNRGKRSITINLQTEGGREVFCRLAAKSDVVVENFRAGTLDRLGVGYDKIRALNSRIIYCSITGMGSTGPERNRPTYDAIAQAMSGLWSQFTDMKRPEAVGPALCDQLGGLYAAYGILGALVGRSLTGQGQKLEVSMLAAGIAFQPTAVADYLMEGAVPDKSSRAPRSQSYGFVAADGLPLAVHLSTPQKFWRGLAETVGKPELVEDPRFATKAGRIKNYEVLRQILGEIFATRPRDEWLARLKEHDVPHAPIYTIDETLGDPQVEHLEMVQTFGQGERALKLVGYPVKYGGTPSEPGLPVPRLGEHTESVLAELGYSEADFTRMRTEGAI